MKTYRIIMTSPRLFLVALLLLAPSFTPAQSTETQDPFAKLGAPQWHLEALKEKPYQLEIAYGEYEPAQADPKFEVQTQLDPRFLESATLLSIATSSNETGEFEERGKHTIKYKLSETGDGTFDLTMHIKVLKGGLKETTTELAITQSEWVVLSGLTRSTNDGTILEYNTAIRITPRTAPQPTQTK